MLGLAEFNSKYLPSSFLSKKVKIFNDNLPDLLKYFNTPDQFTFNEINGEDTYDNCFRAMCKCVEPIVVHVRSGGSTNEQRKEIVQALQDNVGYVNLDVARLIKDEYERRTDIGLQFLSMMN